MKGTPRWVALVAALTLVSVSACGHTYEVVEQAEQNPLRPDRRVIVRPPIVGEITVDGQPEGELMAKLGPAEAQRWVELLNVARGAILSGIAKNRGGITLATAGEAPTLEVALTSIDLAKQDPRLAPRTKLGAVMRLRTPKGSVADEVRFFSTIEAEVVTAENVEATRERRFQRAGLDLGAQIASYLRSRAGID